MTDQSGGGGGSPVWLGVALVFVGMVGKDLFITDQGRDLLIVVVLVFHDVNFRLGLHARRHGEQRERGPGGEHDRVRVLLLLR